MTKLLAIIFDLDGTLIDSAADLREVLNTLLTAHDRRPLSLAETKSLTGDGLRVLLQRAFALTGEPMPEPSEGTVFQDFLRLYQTQKASPNMLYPLVKETLKAFHDKGIKIGLCTNKLYMPTMKLLDELGIGEYFDFVAGGDSFPVCKPHPGHVLGVAKMLETPIALCAMIGDSPNDIRAAKAAGVTSLAIAHGYTQNVHELGADAVIETFDSLPQALRDLGFDFVG